MFSANSDARLQKRPNCVDAREPKLRVTYKFMPAHTCNVTELYSMREIPFIGVLREDGDSFLNDIKLD